MILLARTILLGLLAVSIPVMADAPVVDDGENFALLEEQQSPQAAEEQPVAHDDSYTIREDDEGHALAHDNSGGTTKNTSLLNDIQSLQQDLQELRGQLEVQAHEIDELKQQQLTFYQDLEARFNHTALPAQHPDQSAAQTQDTNLDVDPKSAGGQQQTMSVSTVNASVRGNPADEQISYLAAFDLIKRKKPTNAALAMHQFLNKYPHGGYSANAHYWLGELYLMQKEYKPAMSHFETVLQEFKSSSKCAPSRLKLGYALAEAGRISEAKRELSAVMEQYPDTPVAHMAQNKLHSLGG